MCIFKAGNRFKINHIDAINCMPWYRQAVETKISVTGIYSGEKNGYFYKKILILQG